MRTTRNDRILLAHGGGGQLMDDLIRHHILPSLKNDALAGLGDSARLNLASSSVCFTTDSYVVKPLFFNGGDIGKLAVCGTVNDLAVAGSKPVALALSLIIEDGFEFEFLDKILTSIGQAARRSNVEVVTGDTKTVEAGAADKIFINTAGIGQTLAGVDLGFEKIAVGDKIVINGTIGDHGMTIISQRADIKFESQLKSDCAALAGLTCELLENTTGIKFMRDPTRGGLAATLNEISRSTGLSIEVRETDIPIKPVVQAAADMLGFDVLTIANEGKFVAIVSPESADECLNISRNHPLGADAQIIGEVVETHDVPLVELETRIGGKRIVQMPYGRELPRIC
ncbi:MAG: hydrogenase expression/formation protein HypE [Planctomycetes bacterium]|nr:hydrogenase expression/formation protein HypE [Planctomycetota bacterium]MBL7185464.1 hydrogenase expression/formation protein HypE [Phycisphaerae bacterium]